MIWRRISDHSEEITAVVVPVAVNGALVRWLGVDGFLHYCLLAATGSSLVLTLAVVFSPLDEYPGVISPNFLEFSQSLDWTLLRLFAGSVPVAHVPRPPLRQVGQLTEWLLGIGIIEGANYLVLAWYLAVAPLLYPPYAILGAPARLAIRSPGVAFSEEGGRLTMTPDRSEMPAGAEEFGIAKRPVTFTVVLTTAILWVTSQLV